MQIRTRFTLITAALTAAVLAAPVLVHRSALAQEADPAQRSDEETAETAFLRAYYLEVGKKDPAAALVAYESLLGARGDRAVHKKALLAKLRCLAALGRAEEATNLLDTIVRGSGSDPGFVAKARAVLIPGTAVPSAAEDLRILILASLRAEDYAAAVTAFGERAVPVLSDLLRSADPSTVRRAAGVLCSIGEAPPSTAPAALLHALTDDAVLYPKAIADGLRFNALPEELGRGVVNLDDVELRDGLVSGALAGPDRQKWLLDTVLSEAWARELVFPPERTKHRSLGWLLVEAIAAGPGAARDAALAHVRLYSSKKGEQCKFAPEFADPPPGFIADVEALRSFASHVYDARYAPSPALRDAFLRDPETRELGLRLTWNHSLRCDDRSLLIGALSAGDWARMPNRPVGQIAPVLAESLKPPPTSDEWRAMLPNFKEQNVWPFLEALDRAGSLDKHALEAFADSGHETYVLAWLDQNGCDDGAWAARVIPPLLQHERPEVRVYAANSLAVLHVAGTVDATPHAELLAATLRDPDIYTNARSNNVLGALRSMGEIGRAAIVPVLPFNADVDYAALHQMHNLEMPVAAEVARRMLLADDDYDPKNNVADDAARMLATLEGDAAVPVLIRMLSEGRRDRARRAIGAVWNREELSGEAVETLIRAVLETAPEEISLPNASSRPAAEAQRRVSLLGLASESPRAQQWGALWQTSLLDPEAAPRLGELARSGIPSVRDASRAALAAMRDAEEDLAWMRAVVARRTMRERIQGYLADGDPIKRKAGVAGLVALRASDALEKLLDIAATDADESVRNEARRALLALGNADSEAGEGSSGKGK